MGSYNMAFNKNLFVLLVAGSAPAWTKPQFFNNFNSNSDLGSVTSTTPVPILRYVDTQNIDGSYTYGYEAADGTYKLETRFVDGRVKGKYGYIDPEGNLREASYGAEAGRGFEPKIAGVELPPPVTASEAPIENIIQDPALVKSFKNFKASDEVRKVRRVKATPAPDRFIEEEAAKKANLKARQEQLRSLEQHRRHLVKLQQRQQTTTTRQQQSRAFPAFQREESFRSASPVAAPTSSVSDPYISGFNLNTGAYSYQY